MMISVLSAGYFAASIKKRIELLELFVMLIKQIRTYISYSKLPLTQIVNELEQDGDYKKLGIFISIKSYIELGESVANAFEKSIYNSSGLSSLKQEDKKLMCSFVKSLGASDTDSQLMNCDTYTDLLSERVNSLKQKSADKIKVYNSLGILSAVFIAVLFL